MGPSKLEDPVRLPRGLESTPVPQVSPLAASAPSRVEGRASGAGRAVFLRSLAVMMATGIPLSRALQLLALQSEDQVMARTAGSMASRIQAGVSFSGAMAEHPASFSRLQQRLVKVGEKAGMLHTVLDQLSGYEEKERKTILKLKGTLTYPAFILAVAVLVLIIVPPYMLDGVFNIIKSSGSQPPLLTRLVMAASAFTRQPLFYLLLAGSVVAVTSLLSAMLRREWGRMWLSQRLLQAPGLGRIYRTLAVVRFARALALQLDCGMSLLHSLKLAADASDNPVLEESVEQGIEGLRQGMTVSASLDRIGFFPSLLLRMAQVGEESATLAHILNRTAGIYEMELETALETFAALLEPLVMVVMGVLVGILVLAAILPMLEVLQHL